MCKDRDCWDSDTYKPFHIFSFLDHLFIEYFPYFEQSHKTIENQTNFPIEQFRMYEWPSPSSYFCKPKHQQQQKHCVCFRLVCCL